MELRKPKSSNKNFAQSVGASPFHDFTLCLNLFSVSES